jgi:hypothetical protein
MSPRPLLRVVANNVDANHEVAGLLVLLSEEVVESQVSSLAAVDAGPTMTSGASQIHFAATWSVLEHISGPLGS